LAQSVTQNPELKTLNLAARLPGLDRFNRVDQHHDIDQKAVFDHDDQNDLNQNKKHKGFPKPQLKGNQKPGEARKHVTDRIYNRVTEILERCGRRSVPFDNKGRVFNDLPKAFNKDCCKKKPGERDSFLKKQAPKPVKRDAVQQMRKQIGIKQMLRIVFTPDIARPKPERRIPTAPP